uniref:Mannosyl-oligosaccharide glucosidase n=1 Tax=Albugo laibachii Nc14 TaxID=890382 RepID=F0WCG1_9STRA|nr:mannosyloligosaccharide glucosidase putative [Albugo laibachii Nc14]|eukprot:CCA18876.1 mannosyloligosaccharide glucosidase putative [Albugo laibachii Nc14]
MLHVTWCHTLLASSVILAILLALYDSDFYHHSFSVAKLVDKWTRNNRQRQSFAQSRRLITNPSFDDPIRWGTYQAGMYFGIRSRTYPYHVNAGLLWTCLERRCSDTLRHWSQQEDRLRKYGWLQHDGKTFGYQQIEDQFSGYNIHAQYVNLLPNVKQDRFMHLFSNQFKLTTRKKAVKRKSNYVSLFYYIDLSCGDDGIPHSCREALVRSEGNIFKIENNKPTKCITNDKDEECLYQILTTSTSTSASTESTLRQTFQSSISARVEARVHNRNGSIKSFDVRFQGFAGANIVHVKDKIATQRILSASYEDKDSIEDEDDFIEGEHREETVKEKLSEKELIYLDNTLEDKSLLVVFQVFVELENEDAILNEDDVVMDIVFMEKKLEDEETNEHIEAKEQVKEWEERSKSTNSIKLTLIEAADMERDAFERQFQSTFQLSDTNTWNTSQVEFAKAGLSNLIGGLSYFYGSNMIKMVDFQGHTTGIRTSTPFPLFSATPSRSFFPRGFLWDEGFHQLAILPFNQEITEQVILHWFDAMNENGYIPREMILGKVASARVPEEFLVQSPTHANPPSFLLCLEKYLNMKKGSEEKKKAFMQQIFPSLVAWYEWFLASQQAVHVIESDSQQTDPSADATSHVEKTKLSQKRTLHGFQWRGRDPLDDRLNAITLASGFDDYPRASLPSKEELHVDLLCWMIQYNTILARIATFIGQEDKIIKKFMHQKSAYMETLDIVHWNDTTQTYSDIGMHSADGVMKKTRVARCRNKKGEMIEYPVLKTQCPQSHPEFLFLLGDGHGGFTRRNVYVPGTIRMQHVHHIGYVSIFPLILRILPADTPQLEALLMSIRDPAHLWTPYGLRSLSTRDPFFEVGNRPDDKPYWRGAIWINVNYLALDALMYYSKQDGPYQQMIKDTYTELRQNVISNIYSEYLRTGYFWEQYNGNARMKKSFGRGKRSHPFTGWTSLVVNIMAEVYIHDER